MAKYKGSGVVVSSDYHKVTWTGKTKSGNAVVITLPKAINLGNIDWTFADKDDVVPEITFTGVYTNTDEMVQNGSACDEPWTIEYTAGSGEANNIILGAGVFAIDDVDVALTRGGGSFSVERTFREINADGDRGAVEGRIVMDESRCTLTMNVLQILTRLDDVYAGVVAATT